MRSIFLSVLSILFLGIVQSNAQNFHELIKEGDPLIIAKTESGSYQFIEIPRKNFIIKRGGIASMKSIYNKRVVVKSIQEKNGRYEAVIKPEKGKFFMAYRTLKADLNGAIENGELRIPQKKKRDSMAR